MIIAAAATHIAAVALIAAGALKVANSDGTIKTLKKLGIGLPNAAKVLAISELALGASALVFAGWHIPALVSIAFSGFLIVQVVMMSRFPGEDCHCFGAIKGSESGAGLYANAGVVVLSLLNLAGGPRTNLLDTPGSMPKTVVYTALVLTGGVGFVLSHTVIPPALVDRGKQVAARLKAWHKRTIQRLRGTPGVEVDTESELNAGSDMNTGSDVNTGSGESRDPAVLSEPSELKG